MIGSWICRAARPRCSASASNGTATVRVKYLGRAPLNGDDRYEQKFLASQSWMQVAAKGSSARASQQPPWRKLAAGEPGKSANSVEGGGTSAVGCREPAPAQPTPPPPMAGRWSHRRRRRKPHPLDAPLYWQASPRVAERPQVAATGSLPQAAKQSATDRRLFDPGRLVQEPGKRRQGADHACRDRAGRSGARSRRAEMFISASGSARFPTISRPKQPWPR